MKKNKKGVSLIVLVLVIAIIIAIVATIVFLVVNKSKEGTNNNHSLSQANDNEAKFSNLEYEEGYDFWGLSSEIEKPKMLPLTWEEVNIEGNNFYKTNTPLTIDSDELLSELKNNSYMKDCYEDIRKSQSELHQGINSSMNGFYITYGYYDYIFASKKGTDKSNFSVYTYYNPELYNDPSIISLKMENVNMETFTQEKFYSIAKSIFGDNAEYLVYAKDSDGVSPKGQKLSGLIDMSDIIESNDSSYKFVRTVLYNSDYNTVNIELYIEVSENPKLGDESIFSDKSKLYETIKYTPSNIFDKSFGETNPLNAKSFGMDYFKTVMPEFTDSNLGDWSISTSTHEDGTIDYSFGIKTRNLNNPEDKGVISYIINVSEKDGKITDFYLSTSTNWKGKNTNLYSQQYIDDCINLAKIILPGLEIPTIEYKNGVTFYETNISYTFNNNVFNGTFSINQGNYSYTIILSD